MFSKRILLTSPFLRPESSMMVNTSFKAADWRQESFFIVDSDHAVLGGRL